MFNAKLKFCITLFLTDSYYKVFNKSLYSSFGGTCDSFLVGTRDSSFVGIVSRRRRIVFYRNCFVSHRKTPSYVYRNINKNMIFTISIKWILHIYNIFIYYNDVQKLRGTRFVQYLMKYLTKFLWTYKI